MRELLKNMVKQERLYGQMRTSARECNIRMKYWRMPLVLCPFVPFGIVSLCLRLLVLCPFICVPLHFASLCPLVLCPFISVPLHCAPLLMPLGIVQLYFHPYYCSLLFVPLGIVVPWYRASGIVPVCLCPRCCAHLLVLLWYRARLFVSSVLCPLACAPLVSCPFVCVLGVVPTCLYSLVVCQPRTSSKAQSLNRNEM